ncbi:hypothetical protein PILCRDRAFT_12214 [Piloderma croceum F 1598]|uniref:Uncharacterized protein n=1 Tax=Piloderma croceum (strain F 1598) TaxID=765440 RepID=A0A0C3FBI7_PILCF|nr:hypothetical protein PILCRDRAFT_12214 [Piloderma croceum F 1598]
MSFTTNPNPFLNLLLPAPAIKGTILYPLITTCPSTPLPDDSAGSLTSTSPLLKSDPADHNPPPDINKLYPSDHTTSINMLTNKYPIYYICLKEPIHHERGYVFYKFTSDLFLRFHTPQPTKPPTNLIAIPTFHASDEAAHLVIQEETFHQQVLEEDHVIAPLHTWDRDLLTLSLEKQTWFKEKEPRPKERFDWFTNSEDNIREEVVQILKAKESGSG